MRVRASVRARVCVCGGGGVRERERHLYNNGYPANIRKLFDVHNKSVSASMFCRFRFIHEAAIYS